MPSTYSPSLRIELIGTGEQSGTWGNTTNTNLGSLIEQAIAGVVTLDVTAGDITLTSFNGAVDQARNAVLIVNGTNSVARNIVIPNSTKTYIVTNNTSQNVGVKTSSGTALTCAPTTQTTLYCDGSNNVYGGSISNSTYQSITNPLVTGIRETTTVSATAANGTIGFYTLNQAIVYFTLNATGNWVINFTGNAVTTLNSLMSTGQSFTATFMATQGNTAYYNTGVYVDGSLVTPKWQSGVTPNAGNVNSIDAYTYAIIKTGSGAFVVLASQTRYA